jgi:ribosomal protein S18 acetylase RimI-like enzyme
MRPFDIATDEDLYVEGYCESFSQSFPGVGVTDDLRLSYRASLGHLDGTPELEAFTEDNAGGDPVAFIVLNVQDSEVVRQLSIDILYVNPGYRRRGLGRQLLEKALAYARDRSLPFVKLEVSVGNEAALALYRAAGFATTRLQLERTSAA